jgi:flagellar basal body rod protein FlgC
MISAISTATAGLRASASRFEQSAQNVVKASSPDATSASPDLATSIVDSKTSELSFKANVSVVKTADKMLGSLLDMLA